MLSKREKPKHEFTFTALLSLSTSLASRQTFHVLALLDKAPNTPFTTLIARRRRERLCARADRPPMLRPVGNYLGY